MSMVAPNNPGGFYPAHTSPSLAPQRFFSVPGPVLSSNQLQQPRSPGTARQNYNSDRNLPRTSPSMGQNYNSDRNLPRTSPSMGNLRGGGAGPRSLSQMRSDAGMHNSLNTHATYSQQNLRPTAATQPNMKRMQSSPTLPSTNPLLNYSYRNPPGMNSSRYSPGSPVTEPNTGHLRHAYSTQDLSYDSGYVDSGGNVPSLAMTQETQYNQYTSLVTSQDILPNRHFGSRARSSSPPTSTFTGLRAGSPSPPAAHQVGPANPLIRNPHTRIYPYHDSRKQMRNRELPREPEWEIEGNVWMRMGKYDSQYSTNDQEGPEGPVQSTFGGDADFNLMFLKIDGWSMNIFPSKEASLRHQQGDNECKPLGWIDVRRAHGVSREILLAEDPLTYQISLHFGNGHLRFRLETPEEMQRWMDALHHVVYDVSIQKQVLRDNHHKRTRRFEAVKQILWSAMSNAIESHAEVQYGQVCQLFELYDDDRSGDLEIGEILQMVKEVASIRRVNLINFMQAQEKTVLTNGESFVQGNVSGPAQRWANEAKNLLKLYEDDLNEKKLVREAILMKEKFDVSHNGRLDFNEFRPLAQVVVFPPRLVTQELRFYRGMSAFQGTHHQPKVAESNGGGCVQS